MDSIWPGSQATRRSSSKWGVPNCVMHPPQISQTSKELLMLAGTVTFQSCNLLSKDCRYCKSFFACCFTASHRNWPILLWKWNESQCLPSALAVPSNGWWSNTQNRLETGFLQDLHLCLARSVWRPLINVDISRYLPHWKAMDCWVHWADLWLRLFPPLLIDSPFIVAASGRCYTLSNSLAIIPWLILGTLQKKIVSSCLNSCPFIAHLYLNMYPYFRIVAINHPLQPEVDPDSPHPLLLHQPDGLSLHMQSVLRWANVLTRERFIHHPFFFQIFCLNMAIS